MNHEWSRRSADRYKSMLTGVVGTAETFIDSWQRMAEKNDTPEMIRFREGIKQFAGLYDEDRIQHLESLGFEYWMVRDIAGSKASLMADLLTLVPDFNRLEVLDVASGKGDMLVHLAKEFRLCRGVGLDPSQRHRQFAQKLAQSQKVEPLTFIDGRATNLPFNDCAFDVVISTLAMHWSIYPERWLSEMARVLRFGGYFYLNYHNRDSCSPDEARKILAASSVEITKLDAKIQGERIGYVTIEGQKKGG